MFKDALFPNETFNVINSMKKTKELCDVIIKVENHEFFAHRVILAAVSPYLRAMFTNGMLESGQKTIEIQGIDCKTMEMLIDFSYTGNIDINKQNVEMLLSGSNLLNIKSLSMACSQYLSKQLDPANCIGIRNFAILYSCNILENEATQFIYQNFIDVAFSEEFLRLKSKDVINILQSDSIQIRSEELVYDAIERWLNYDFSNRQKYFPELLKLVRFPLISLEYLESKVFPSPLIKFNPSCQFLLAKVMNEQPENLPAYLCTKRALPQSIYVIGGRNTTSCHLSSVERYDVHKRRWVIEKNISIARTAISSVSMNGFLYAIGGECAVHNPENETLYLPYVEYFDPILRHWIPVTDLTIPRSFVSATVCQGNLYVIGGENHTTSFNILEQYCEKANCWILKKPMHKCRAGAGVTSHNGMIYIAGGFDRSIFCDRSSVECYCPIKDEWTFVAEMEKARSGLNLVSLDSYIYAIGGRNRDTDTYFDLCERFDPRTGQWSTISAMHSPRAWPGVVMMKRKIYVLGGFDGVDRLSCVEVYDAEENKWSYDRSMNYSRAGCGAALL